MINDISNIIGDVSIWLRQKMRSEKFYLIKEENMNYGFVRNIYSVKKIFLWLFSVYTIILLTTLCISIFATNSLNNYFKSIPLEHIICCLIHIATYLIWIFGITNNLLVFVSKKYAKAVVEAIDKLD